MSDMQLLFQLQEIELELDKLQKKLKTLPVFAEFKALQNEVADAKEALGWAEGKLTEHKKRVKRLEQELQKTEQSHKDVNDSLYGNTQSAKELEQLGKKEEGIKQEKDRQEENLLLAMELTEDLQNALDRARQEHAGLSKDRRALQKTGNEEIGGIKEKILLLREERDSLLQQADNLLLAEYKDKRTKFQGRPLARLDGEICGGCRVSVSSNTRSLLCRPNAKVLCENCGRILIPLLPKNAFPVSLTEDTLP